MASSLRGEYRVITRNGFGTKVTDSNDFDSLKVYKVDNAPGYVEMSYLRSSSFGTIQKDYTVEIWRRNVAYGAAWRLEFVGLVGEVDGERIEGTSEWMMSIKAPGILSIIGWRHNLYYPDVTGKSQFTSVAVGDIIRTLVAYNCVQQYHTQEIAGGTPVLQRRQGTALYGSHTITLHGDGVGHGPIVPTLGCAWVNVLKQIQELAETHGVRFTMYPVVDADPNRRSWEFRYLGYGTDNGVILSEGLGSLEQISWRDSQLNRKNTFIVAGQGEGTARQIITHSGMGSSDERIEHFVDAKNAKTSGELIEEGKKADVQYGYEELYDVKVVQTPSAVYGVHYEVGDWVSIERRKGSLYYAKIRAATMIVEGEEGDEQLDIELHTV